MALVLAERWGRPLTDLLDVPAPILELQYKFIAEIENPPQETDEVISEETDPLEGLTTEEVEALTAASNIAKQYG